MIEPWLIEELEKMREERTKEITIPLYLPLPEDFSDPIEEETEKESGVIIIQM